MQTRRKTLLRIILITAVLVIVVMAAMVWLGVLTLWVNFGSTRWEINNASVRWEIEHFHFESGATCYVFVEPKLVVFLGDGGADEVFDRITSSGYSVGFAVNEYFGNSSTRHGSDNDVAFLGQTSNGKTTLQFNNGKCRMAVSGRGTKLTLADGREFTLDGKTPIVLRCKPDGEIVQLDELPEGFVEFFESPPSDPGLIQCVKSYPEAFRK